VNAVPADDNEKLPVSERNKKLKGSVERYRALQRNVLLLLYIIVPHLNIVSSIANFVTQLINLNTSHGGKEHKVY
jgi:D-alanyl-lipoteichoic acid acyltransferase DltB (MBOAT superfamily)